MLSYTGISLFIDWSRDNSDVDFAYLRKNVLPIFQVRSADPQTGSLGPTFRSVDQLHYHVISATYAKILNNFFRERESTYGTISYAGHRPKEQMILHPFDEVEEDNFNQSRSSSPTDSILSDNSETSV